MRYLIFLANAGTNGSNRRNFSPSTKKLIFLILSSYHHDKQTIFKTLCCHFFLQRFVWKTNHNLVFLFFSCKLQKLKTFKKFCYFVPFQTLGSLHTFQSCVWPLKLLFERQNKYCVLNFKQSLKIESFCKDTKVHNVHFLKHEMKPFHQKKVFILVSFSSSLCLPFSKCLSPYFLNDSVFFTSYLFFFRASLFVEMKCALKFWKLASYFCLAWKLSCFFLLAFSIISLRFFIWVIWTRWNVCSHNKTKQEGELTKYCIIN